MILTNPFVEFKAVLAEVISSKVPVVKALALKVRGVCVLAVVQSQLCAKFLLSIELFAVPSISPEIGVFAAVPKLLIATHFANPKL
jgi:hypothetical protein